MKPCDRHTLFLSACSIFTLFGFLTVLFVVFKLPFSWIFTSIIICVASLLTYSVYSVYLCYRCLYLSRDQRIGETTHLLEGRDNLEIGSFSASDVSDVATENSDRKQSSPRPTPKLPKPKVTYQHPTPMPHQSYLTDMFMSKFKALGDFIRSRRHTVSESGAIGLDNITVDPSKPQRVHTKSESEIVNQALRWKQLLPNRDEDLFEMEFGAEQYDIGYKKS